MPISQLSRREVLKLAAAGSLAYALIDLNLDHALASSPVTQGLVTISGTPLYEAPTFNSKKMSLFKKDEVLKITAVDENGEPGNPYNSVWYQINGGFSYSGLILPVETNYQKPLFDVPKDGRIGEITVPYCDTKKSPYVYADRGYRLYYGSTHWVTKIVVTSDEKSIWYEIYDKEIKKHLYIASHNMRLVPYEEMTPLSPDIPQDQKRIVVDLKTQMVTAFEGDSMVFSQRCSSGAKGTETPKGEYLTYHKGPSVHMTNQGDALENIYNLPGVPWCSFFTGLGHAFHGTYWHNDYGRPRSHGCVNLPSEAAKFIYRWTMPVVPPDEDYLSQPGQGTTVQIF